MLDLKFIRENPQLVRENIEKKFRHHKLELLDKLLNLDKTYLSVLREVEVLRSKRNKISKSISEAKKKGEDATEILKQAKEIPKQLVIKDKELSVLKEQILELQYEIPNIIADDVPIGENDSKNVVKRNIGDAKKKDFEVKSHVDIVEALNVADFETAGNVAGNGFYYLKGDLALLNQALIRFGIDYMNSKGYTYVEPPLMLNKKAIHSVMPFSDFKEHAYKIEDKNQYLIATAEHPLVAMFKDKVLDKKSLPIKVFGYSMSFRQEIGAHGIDEKGLYRTHQFNKVEQVVICEPEDSAKIYEEIMQNSIEIYEKLGLPTRILECCSGDLSDLKYKSEDLEVYSPRKDDYFEVGSCSNLTSAQARRTNIRVFDGQKKYFPHSLNNTALATSRCMVAILENYQNEDGSITIPQVLRKYMYSKEKINTSE